MVMFYTCTPHLKAHMLWTLCHGALRFIIYFKALPHHCLLYECVNGLLCLHVDLNIGKFYIVLGLLPSYLLTYNQAE